MKQNVMFLRENNSYFVINMSHLIVNTYRFKIAACRLHVHGLTINHGTIILQLVIICIMMKPRSYKTCKMITSRTDVEPVCLLTDTLYKVLHSV